MDSTARRHAVRRSTLAKPLAQSRIPAGAAETRLSSTIRTRPHRSVDAALLALRPAGPEPSALPGPESTVRLAEIVHRALVERAACGQRIDCPELTGHDAHGQPLCSGHRHAHISPLDLDADGRLDHVLVWAPMGFGETACRAIFSLRRIWDVATGWRFRVRPSAVRPAHCRHVSELCGLSAAPSPVQWSLVRFLAPERRGATVWSSLTPFVAPRHEKPRGRNSLTGQVQAELASRGLPPASAIEPLPERAEQLQACVRPRSFGRRPPVAVGHALRLRFDRPIPGPLALGYAAHFGLGLFAADTPEREGQAP